MWTIQQQALLRSEPPSCRVPELRRGHDFGAEQGSRSYCVRELGQGRRRLFQHLADDVSWTVTGSSPVAGTYTSRRDSSRGGPFNLSARVCRNRFGPRWRGSLRRETRSSCSGMVMRWRRTAWVRQPLLLGHANGARDCQGG